MPFEFIDTVFGIGDARMDGTELERIDDLRPTIERIARSEGVPPALVAGIISVESSARPEAVNPDSRAQGLMQVMPANFKNLGVPSDRWLDPETNIEVGIRILKEQGLGQKPVEEVLAGYGGFETKDPSGYIRKVRSRATRLAARHGFSALA